MPPFLKLRLCSGPCLQRCHFPEQVAGGQALPAGLPRLPGSLPRALPSPPWPGWEGVGPVQLVQGRGAISRHLAHVCSQMFTCGKNSTLDKLPKYNHVSPLPNTMEKRNLRFAATFRKLVCLPKCMWDDYGAPKPPKADLWWWFLLCLWPIFCEVQCSVGATDDLINVYRTPLSPVIFIQCDSNDRS